MSQLAEAILHQTEAEAMALIRQGADVNETDKFGLRPLIEAIIAKKWDVFLTLLEYGADIEQKDTIARTPLQWASDRAELDYCKKLLEFGANPNHYSADGQPILVNPILREQQSLVEMMIAHGANYNFAQDFISTKLLGHRFELTGEADIVSPQGSFIPLSYEGFYLEFTCGLIYRSLKNYIHSIPGQKYDKYHVLCNKMLRALKSAAVLMGFHKHQDKTPFQKTIDSLLKEELLILPMAHQGHAITFIKYRNLLAKCDRGVNHLADTVVIYDIGNPYLLDRPYYYHMLYEKRSDTFPTIDIKMDLALKSIKTLPTKSQLSGNCSWANVEATIPAMLYMLLYHEKQSQQQVSHIKRSVMAFYNAWVEWDKDSSLEEAIEDLHESDPKRALSKATSLGSILVQRCHHANPKEVVRARKILTILGQPNYQFLLKTYKRLYFKNKAGTIGDSFKKLLEVCGLDLETLELQVPSWQAANQYAESNDVIKMTTALHVAALRGELEMVRHMVETLGIDVNYVDRTGSTALMYAAWKGFDKIVEYLLAHGADASVLNYKGGTAKRYAAYAGHHVLLPKL